MSDFITGHEILEQWDIAGFELFNHVSAGMLEPYDRLGRLRPHPYFLPNLELERLKAKLRFQEDIVEQTNNYTVPQDHPQRQSLEASIREKRENALNAIAWLKSELYDGSKAGTPESLGWRDSELPENEEKAQELLYIILESLYRKQDVLRAESQLGFKKLLPSQKAKIQCREVAEKLWKQDDSITIAAMSEKKEILEAGGEDYAPKTLRRWIKDLSPNRRPGRRPKKT